MKKIFFFQLFLKLFLFHFYFLFIFTFKSVLFLFFKSYFKKKFPRGRKLPNSTFCIDVAENCQMSRSCQSLCALTDVSYGDLGTNFHILLHCTQPTDLRVSFPAFLRIDQPRVSEPLHQRCSVEKKLPG